VAQPCAATNAALALWLHSWRPAARVAELGSRSDRMMVAVGFSPRIGVGVGPRRVATLEMNAQGRVPPFNRRYAIRR
jgi:hypothetical protein